MSLTENGSQRRLASSVSCVSTTASMVSANLTETSRQHGPFVECPHIGLLGLQANGFASVLSVRPFHPSHDEWVLNQMNLPDKGVIWRRALSFWGGRSSPTFGQGIFKILLLPLSPWLWSNGAVDGALRVALQEVHQRSRALH